MFSHKAYAGYLSVGRLKKNGRTRPSAQAPKPWLGSQKDLRKGLSKDLGKHLRKDLCND